jgi:REP element-mobilizing transposase RayT
MSNYRDEFLADTHYLISNKWFNNNVLFESGDDYKTFILYVIANLLDHPVLSISAYCILPKHFHLVVKNKEKWFKLSDFMRKIQVSYAMYFKKKNSEKTELKWVPVFEWRFKATAIEINNLENIESCVAYDPIYHEAIEDIKNRPYTSAHQIVDTGYNYMTQTHIKVYNDGRKIHKNKHFDDNH